MIAVLVVIALVALGIVLFVNQPMFGKMPTGKRLTRIENSPNFRNGAFQNLSITPSLAEGESFFKVLRKFLFQNKVGVKPLDDIPSIKTDLHNLSSDEDVLVWFGHSSYFMQVDGKKILVDPVLSGSASPLPFSVQAFNGSNIYSPDDIPEIDYLFITHDHWDHLDYQTIKKLKSKIKHVVCALGVGEHLEYWGYNPNIITETDWNEKIDLSSGFEAHSVPGRHFSGRLFKRNQTLWMAYVLQTPKYRIFIGGDSGYDTHFTRIGESFGPFDLVILENGQYNMSWRYIHMLPDQALQAARDLKAKRMLPVHSSKFALSSHPWKEPLTKVTGLNKDNDPKIITPIIGEIVNLQDTTQQFSRWWEGVE